MFELSSDGGPMAIRVIYYRIEIGLSPGSPASPEPHEYPLSLMPWSSYPGFESFKGHSPKSIHILYNGLLPRHKKAKN
jgi:hypothetical protein